MSKTRTRLSDRRPCNSFDYVWDGIQHTVSVGFYPDGTLAEIFINCAKEGSAANTVARETAVVLSIALQHGTPLQTISDALPKLLNGQPAGPLGVALSQVSGGAV